MEAADSSMPGLWTGPNVAMLLYTRNPETPARGNTCTQTYRHAYTQIRRHAYHNCTRTCTKYVAKRKRFCRGSSLTKTQVSCMQTPVVHHADASDTEACNITSSEEGNILDYRVAPEYAHETLLATHIVAQRSESHGIEIYAVFGNASHGRRPRRLPLLTLCVTVLGRLATLHPGHAGRSTRVSKTTLLRLSTVRHHR